MKELHDIVREWQKRRGQSQALATIVETRGSTYRRPGAHMLIGADGSSVGAVSGGCLERDVIAKGLEVIASGRPVVAEYDTTEPDDAIFGSGLGCRGIVRLLLEPVPAGADDRSFPLLAFAAEALRRPDASAAVTVLPGDDGKPLERLFVGGIGEDGDTVPPGELRALLLRHAEEHFASGRSGRVTIEGLGDPVEAFFEVIQPPVHLLVFGAGYDAVPVVRLARELGLSVTVVDHRPTHALPGRFPEADAVLLLRPDELPGRVLLTHRTAALLMTHSYAQDQALLEALAPSPVPYLGVLGPKGRTGEILESLRAQGVTLEEIPGRRIKSPVGLDLGAETPEQIALSILAEVQAFFTGHGGGPLSRRAGPIHEPVP
jgi:xanthine dehydrogenase accessory factor